MTIRNIIQDISDLRGATVSIFGQPTQLDEGYDENDPIIDILDVLDNLKRYESDMTVVVYNEEDEEYEEIEVETVDEYLEMALEVFEEVKSDNSYNWSSPVSNDFNFTIHYDRENDRYLVEFKVHRYGDVRGNYTETALLEFDNDYEFYDVLLESNKTLHIDDLEIEVDIFSDMMTVFFLDDEVGRIHDLDELEELAKEYAS